MGAERANTGGAESNYAMLTFLVGTFAFELRDPNEKIEIKGGVTVKPGNGLHMKLRVIKGW